MFIDPLRGDPALRQEGDVDAVGVRPRPTSVGHSLMFHVHTSWTDMALLTEGKKRFSWQL